MPNNENNKKEKVGTNSNNTKSTKQRENGKMKDQSLNLDRLTISKQREIIRIRQMVDNLPEQRIDWIGRLTKEIDEGTYHVSSKMIAEAIIQKNLYTRPH